MIPWLKAALLSVTTILATPVYAWEGIYGPGASTKIWTNSLSDTTEKVLLVCVEEKGGVFVVQRGPENRVALPSHKDGVKIKSIQGTRANGAYTYWANETVRAIGEDEDAFQTFVKELNGFKEVAIEFEDGHPPVTVEIDGKDKLDLDLCIKPATPTN